MMTMIVGIFMLIDSVALTNLVEMTVQIRQLNLRAEHEGFSEVSPFMYEHWLLTTKQLKKVMKNLQPDFSISTGKAVDSQAIL